LQSLIDDFVARDDAGKMGVRGKHFIYRRSDLGLALILENIFELGY
jgi:hypothetical protein